MGRLKLRSPLVEGMNENRRIKWLRRMDLRERERERSDKLKIELFEDSRR